jgi:hypothetical protein
MLSAYNDVHGTDYNAVNSEERDADGDVFAVGHKKPEAARTDPGCRREAVAEYQSAISAALGIRGRG